MSEHVSGANLQAGRTHILPKPGDSFSYWVKAIGGMLSIIGVIVAVTLYVSSLPQSAEKVRAELQAQATYNAQVFETKADAKDREQRFLDAMREMKDEIKEELKGIRADLKEPRYIPAS